MYKIKKSNLPSTRYLIYKVIDPLLKYFSRSSLIIDERKRNPEGSRRESKQTFNPQTSVPTSGGTRTIRLSNANIICTRPLYRRGGRGAAGSISHRGWIPNPLPPFFSSSCWNRVSKRINWYSRGGGPKCLAPVILQDESFKSGEINNNFDRIGAAFDRSRSNFARFEERAQLSASHRLRSDESRDDNDGRIASTRVLLVLHVSTFLSWERICIGKPRALLSILLILSTKKIYIFDIIRIILTRYWIISMTISIVEQFNGEMDVSYSIPLGGKRREKFIGDEDLRFTWWRNARIE